MTRIANTLWATIQAWRMRWAKNPVPSTRAPNEAEDWLFAIIGSLTK